jgi:hypothetical protein
MNEPLHTNTKPKEKIEMLSKHLPPINMSGNACYNYSWELTEADTLKCSLSGATTVSKGPVISSTSPCQCTQDLTKGLATGATTRFLRKVCLKMLQIAGREQLVHFGHLF